MTRIDNALGNKFNVDVTDVEVKSISTTTIDTPISIPNNDTLEEDAAAVRKILYSLLKSGEESFDDLSKIARAEESPRAFEVLNSYLSNLSAISMQLIDLHEKKSKIKNSKPKEETQQAINNGTVNNNTVFVGTTADLQDALKKINMDKQ